MPTAFCLFIGHHWKKSGSLSFLLPISYGITDNTSFLSCFVSMLNNPSSAIHQESPGPSLQSCSPTSKPSVCTRAWGNSSLGQGSAIPDWTSWGVIPPPQTLRPVSMSLNSSTTIWFIRHSPPSSVCLKTPRGTLCPSFKSLIALTPLLTPEVRC